ncbi:hypothetical protein A1QO_04270 [Vibrio genomosp. F10 str. ZF-129]|uniref:Uncharacterized protein n=2 Tax=Vibrio genomosp. F10 TaxID=723171 RepID=A0A1E5BIT2_9VIBR|nr:hypothetical protein A1QO_04270 [Vibrio genomosp. F10 str. ZF-129]
MGPKHSMVEFFNQTTLCGKSIILELHGTHGSITKMTIGSRFDVYIKSLSSGGLHNSKLNQIFNFFNHYLPLIDISEIGKAWQCYQKALSQKSDSINSAFWNYFEGKRIRFLDRKKTVFEWCLPNS